MEIRIKQATLTKNGISIIFSRQAWKFWFTIPGASIGENKKHSFTIYFSGQYDVDLVVDTLKKLPLRNPFDDKLVVDEFLIIRSKTYKQKSYTPYSDKVIPRKERVGQLQPDIQWDKVVLRKAVPCRSKRFLREDRSLV